MISQLTPLIQIDLQLESGEYFLKSREKEARDMERRKQKVILTALCDKLSSFVPQQAEVTAKRRAERAVAFVPPTEDAAPPVDAKRKRRRDHSGVADRENKKK